MGASELQEEVDLSGRAMVGMEGAAAGVASGQGTGQRKARTEEDQEEGKTPAEKMEVALWVGRSPGLGEAGRRRKTAG